jgi:hypothetical protein
MIPMHFWLSKQRDFLVMATQSKKPTNGASLDTAKIMPFLKDLQVVPQSKFHLRFAF